MDQLEFSIAIHLVRKKLQGTNLPKVLPASLKVDSGKPGVTTSPVQQIPQQQQQKQASAAPASQAVPATKPTAAPPQQAAKNTSSATAPPLSKSSSVSVTIAAFMKLMVYNVTIIVFVGKDFFKINSVIVSGIV